MNVSSERVISISILSVASAAPVFALETYLAAVPGSWYGARGAVQWESGDGVGAASASASVTIGGVQWAAASQNDSGAQGYVNAEVTGNAEPGLVCASAAWSYIYGGGGTAGDSRYQCVNYMGS